MKVFISSDMEGTAGVVDWDQCVTGGSQYDYYTELLTGEVNAAIEGAAAAGATEFLVNDSHSKMANLKPEALAGRAAYLSGRYKPMYMMQGLDTSFDAVFFVSYHGSMGSRGSTLSHTYFPTAFAEVTINGRVAGEAGINALVAAAYRVPIVLVTGDDITAVETRRFCPDIHAAVVKKSVTRFAAASVHPADARDLIRNEATAAIKSLASASPPVIRPPVSLDISFRSSDYCELADRIEGVKRTGDLAASIVGDDPLWIYQTFVTVVLLCRGLVE
ncbi:MAG TPA: M55 family metallopeptidase [Pseudonocardiaceae bacterium]|nr:M55 family metallopeptidase [Pseudonocardiaceae bacterium]